MENSLRSKFNAYLPVWLLALLLTVSLLIGQAVAAQQAPVVTGQVIDDERQEGIPGVNIVLKGSNTGAITDATGHFSMAAPTDGVLVFSNIGYLAQEVPVNGQSTLSVTLQTDVRVLEDLVVVGYAQTRRDALASAVTTITADNFANTSYSSVLEKLQGQVPGLQISNNSGVPGTSVLVRLRGATSIKAGNDPLYVVDGVFINNEDMQRADMGGQTPNPLADLNPADVESVSVLKDANATALYGARGANGVILITTKRGARNAGTTVNFNAEYGVAKATNLWELVTGPQHAELVNLVHLNDGKSYATRPFRPKSEVIAGFPAYGTPEEQGTYDRIDDVFRTAHLQKYTVSLSGGQAKTNFYLGLEYQNQEATLKLQDFERYSFRFNLDHSLSDKVKIGTSNALSYVPRRLVRVGDGPAGLFQAALHTPTFYPFYNADGTYAKPTVFDSHLAILDNSDVHSKSLRSINNIYLQWHLLANLSFKSSWSNDYNNYHEQAYYNTNLVYGQPAGQAEDYTTVRQTLIAEQLLNYSATVGRSELAVFAGNTVQRTTFERQELVGTNFPSNQFKEISAAAVQTAYTTSSSSGLLSFFSGVNYTYANRYIVDVNLRADASSRFGSSHRWGYFPSVGLAWNLSDEDFFPKESIVDELRVKTSLGLTGNQDIDDFAARGLWEGGRNYTDKPGTAPNQMANPDLKWETTRQWNAGLSAALFNQRLSLGFDYYDKYTYDLLLDQPLPVKTGFSSVVRNVGEVSNRGVELLVKSVNLKKNSLTWETTFAISKNINTVEKLITPIVADSYSMYRVEEGHPLYSIYAYHDLGVDPQTGNARYEDVVPDDKITVADNKIVGNIWPDFEGSIRNVVQYGGWSLNFNFFYKYGNSIYNYTRYFLETAGTRGVTRSIQTSSLKYWKEPGDTDVLPRPTNTTNPDGSLNYFRTGSSRYLEDASYIRLRDVTLSYDLPVRLAAAAHLKKVRVYVTGTNLLTFTNYSGPDPEVNVAADNNNGLVQGLDFGTPPQPVSIVFGINASL